MSDHDDLIREAQAIRDAKARDRSARPIAEVFNDMLDALVEAQPVLAVRGEEELTRGLDRTLNVVTTPERRESLMQETARDLIANDIVQVVPSLEAASRDSVKRAIHKGIFERFPISVMEAVGYTQDGYDSLLDSIADTLLAGPVQVADTETKGGDR